MHFPMNLASRDPMNVLLWRDVTLKKLGSSVKVLKQQQKNSLYKIDFTNRDIGAMKPFLSGTANLINVKGKYVLLGIANLSHLIASLANLWHQFTNQCNRYRFEKRLVFSKMGWTKLLSYDVEITFNSAVHLINTVERTTVNFGRTKVNFRLKTPL